MISSMFSVRLLLAYQAEAKPLTQGAAFNTMLTHFIEKRKALFIDGAETPNIHIITSTNVMVQRRRYW